MSHRVDVVETGEIRFCGDQEYEPPGWILNQRFLPIQPGIQIANRTNSEGDVVFSGTLGGIVQDSDGIKYILSNHHVLINMGTDVPVLHQDVVQPGDDDDDDDAVIGRNYSYIGLYRGIGTSNVVDAALASIDDQDDVILTLPGNRMDPVSADHQAIGLYFASNSSHDRGRICRINPILEDFGMSFLSPDATHEVDGFNMFDPVEKVGARTGYGSSQIYDIDAEIKVTMRNGKVYNFENLNRHRKHGMGR